MGRPPRPFAPRQGHRLKASRKASSAVRYANPFHRTWRKHREPEVTGPPKPRPTGRFAFARLVIAEWQRIDAQALAAQVAYSLVFAVPALLLFLLAIAAVIDKRTGIPVADRLRDGIDEYAPESLQELLDSIVDNAVVRAGGETASLGAVAAVLFAIWGASGGVNALINACNRAYGLPDTRSFVAKRVLALLLTGVFALFSLLTTVLFIGGRELEQAVYARLDLGGGEQRAWELLRWPAFALPVACALFLLYTIGPVFRPPVRWTAVGALAAAAAWLLLLAGFRFILTLINPGTPYGATGSVLVFLSFLRLTGGIFILGAALTGLLVRRFHPAV